MGVIIFNGKASSDYEIVVEHPPVYTIPKRRVESISVPGRNGNILIDEGVYDNVKREYDIAAGDIWDERFTEIAQSISQWLHSANGGYAVLEDTYEPEYFRMAMYSEEVEIENILMQAGRATISFDCKPQRFLKSGNKIFSFTGQNTSAGASPHKLINTTPYASNPLIVITRTDSQSGIGNFVFTINNQAIYGVSVDKNNMVIDCENLDVYALDSTNLNGSIRIGTFPQLKPGANSLDLYSIDTTLKMEVKPRWWVL